MVVPQVGSELGTPLAQTLCQVLGSGPSGGPSGCKSCVPGIIQAYSLRNKGNIYHILSSN